MTSIAKLSPSSIIVLIALALPTTLGCIDVMAGLAMTPATMHVPQHKVGVASSVVFTLRWVGGAYGIVLTTLMFKYESFSAACIYLACTAVLGMACSAFISKK